MQRGDQSSTILENPKDTQKRRIDLLIYYFINLLFIVITLTRSVNWLFLRRMSNGSLLFVMLVLSTASILLPLAASKPIQADRVLIAIDCGSDEQYTSSDGIQYQNVLIIDWDIFYDWKSRFFSILSNEWAMHWFYCIVELNRRITYAQWTRKWRTTRIIRPLQSQLNIPMILNCIKLSDMLMIILRTRYQWKFLECTRSFSNSVRWAY